MTDNTTLNAMTGGDVIATDDIAGVKHQLVKIEYGAADSATQVSPAAPLPVVLRDSAAADAMGDVTASPGANTLLGRLKALLTGIILAAGENHIGAVGGNSVVVGGSFTRPANTTAYTIGNLIANSTTAGSVVPIPCAAARVNAGTGVVRRIRVSTNQTGLTGTEIVRVTLYKNSPTVTNGDGGAFAANGIASLSLGYTDVVLTHVYNDGSKGFAAVDIVFDAASGSQNIYATLETRTGFTPTSGATYALALEVLQD